MRIDIGKDVELNYIMCKYASICRIFDLSISRSSKVVSTDK